MPATPTTLGQTLAVTFDHGDDFFAELNAVCEEHEIRQGYIPMFIAGFRRAHLVGACDRVDGPEAPVWTGVHLENLEFLTAAQGSYEFLKCPNQRPRQRAQDHC